MVIVAVAFGAALSTELDSLSSPVLSFLPVTLFFIGYGEGLFSQPLTTPQYALAWTGLGLIHFLAAIFADRVKVRYAHPLYLGAYSLLTWSVIWSLIERSTFVWTLGLWILCVHHISASDPFQTPSDMGRVHRSRLWKFNNAFCETRS